MHYALSVLLIALPWVFPVTYGPAPSTAGWVLSGLCLGILGWVTLWVRRNAGKPRGAHCVPTAWLAAALLSTLIALAQYFGAASALGDWVNPGELGQAYANLRQRNHFATLTNLGLAALLWWHASGQAQRLLVKPNPVWELRATVALAVLLAFGNAASGSRTGLLQLLLLGVFTWIWRPKHLPWTQSPQCQTLVVAACAYVLAMLVLPLLIGLDPSSSGILGRLQDASAACQSRRVLWANVLHLIAQKPWFGWGWASWITRTLLPCTPARGFATFWTTPTTCLCTLRSNWGCRLL